MVNTADNKKKEAGISRKFLAGYLLLVGYTCAVAFFLDANVNLIEFFFLISLLLLLFIEAFLCCVERNYSRVMQMLLIATMLVGINRYKDLKIRIARFTDYLEAREKILPKCSEADPHSCHSFAAIARNWGNKAEAGKYFAAACFLGDEEACADWNTVYTKDKELSASIRESVSGILCGKGNLTSCVQKAGTLLKAGKPDEAMPLLDEACKADIAGGCGLLGDAYSGRSVITAIEYLNKACRLSPYECWREEYVCSGLTDNWRFFEKNGELEKTLEICTSLCRKGYKSACWRLGFYKDEVKRLEEKKAEKFEEEGDIISAAYHYEKLCEMGSFACYKKDHVCGSSNIRKFVQKGRSREEKLKTIEFCTNYCNAGIATACGGVASFYSGEVGDYQYESLKFLQQECKLAKDESDCRSLSFQCKFRYDPMIKAHPDKVEEIERICGKYRR